MKIPSNEETKTNKPKKMFNRQKSINPNIIPIKDTKVIMSQNEIKPKNNIHPEMSPKILLTKRSKESNTKPKKNRKISQNSILIKNESSYTVLESFLNEHQIKCTSSFILYLSEIWRELSLYSSDYNLGIIPFAFSRYFRLPGLINKRLFDVLDVNKDGYLSPKEFIHGLSILFCEEICSLIEFIFSFYDFNYDGYITSEDIHAIMSYIPVINSFNDMIDIEEEIQTTLEQIFVDDKNKLNLKEFTDLIINKERYEIFIPIISFFFEQKPFTNQEINYFYKEIISKDNMSTKQHFYQIEGKIKLKVEKDENISKAYEDKIIFDFDKSKVDDYTHEYENLGRKISYDRKILMQSDSYKNNVSVESNSINNRNNPINNIKDNISNGSYTRKNNNNHKYIKPFENDINSESNYEENNNQVNLKVIEDTNEEDYNNTGIDNGNNNNILVDLQKASTFAKKSSNTSSNVPVSKMKTFSRQNSVRNFKTIKKNVISHFANHDEISDKYDIGEDLDKNKELKEKRKEQFRIRTQSMRNIKYKKENLKDLVSKSKGFKRLQNSIPSLINNTKILARYSSRNINTSEYSGLSQFRKGGVIQDLCKSKINLENDNNINIDNKNNERKITEDSYEIERNEAGEFIGVKLINNDNQKEENNVNKNQIGNKSEFQNKEHITYESYLYKITPNSKKLKKLYFKLYNKNLYYYKNENSAIHKGMHNLCHYFLELSEDNENESEESSILVEKNSYKEDDDSFLDSNKSDKSNKSNSDFDSEIIIKKINSIDYYCFILISQKGKVQWYLTPDKEIYNKWVDALKLAMNYKDVLDQYEFKEVIGKGKFSIVYYAYDKINKRKVAIKRIDKTILKLPELELIKTEIDILRICQHPYVIGLYDVIETFSSMDIILEFCQIGNLYNYLYKRKFNITEQQIVTYIHKISKAVYSMHNLGIIHRDLKLSNIAMADGNEEDIRILDFGLSKIIGPDETCCESYGTPGYAAPEVINEESYRFKADVWSIGAIAYFMCSSKLPYDYPTKGLNKTNIILNTLNDEIKFNDDCWKKYSKEAKKFIKACMNKNPEKRLNIKQVLEHEWIKKYFYREVKNRESCSNVIISKENGRNPKKALRQKSYQKKLSSLATTYRLYADISDK